ncbi:hypothetical protein ABZS76_32865 [Streptomyces sp. NPDC005562]|uniref:hypothetical protein n=1 Tax=Streptomyces sp. NPDC005562 TaxID=3154890 RepID=UPI0033AE1565
MTITKIRFETTACGRCSGTGAHGPKMVKGGICFQCHGKGDRLTRRGCTARDRYDALVIERLGAPVTTLKPGDTVFSQAHTWAGIEPVTYPARWRTIESITITETGSVGRPATDAEGNETGNVDWLPSVTIKFRGGRETSRSLTPEELAAWVLPRHDHDTLAEIMTEIAVKYTGAWLDGEEPPALPARKPRTAKAEAAPKATPLAANLYPGDCRHCGGHVAAKEGERLQLDGRWTVQHTAGECPAPQTQQTAQEAPVNTPAPAQPEPQSAPAAPTVSVTLPGPFLNYFAGTSLAQGEDDDTDPECLETRIAFDNGRQGTTPDGGTCRTLDATATVLRLLDEYAVYCMDANADGVEDGEEGAQAEYDAAQTLQARVRTARAQLRAQSA